MFSKEFFDLMLRIYKKIKAQVLGTRRKTQDKMNKLNI